MNRILILISLLIGSLAHAEDATEIAKKAEELVRLPTMTAIVTSKHGTEGKVEKTKVFNYWRKLQNDRLHNFTLTQFIEPADIKGEAVLIQEYAENQNNMFLYLPTFRKTRRIEGYDQGKSFMGTVFSYSDVASAHYVNYKYSYTKKERCPGGEVGECHMLTAIPKTEDIKKRTHYSKVIQWVRITDGLLVYEDVYDLDGKLEKHIQISKFTKVSGGKWFALEVRADRLNDKKFSVFEYKSLKVGAEISDSVFREEGMSASR